MKLLNPAKFREHLARFEIVPPVFLSPIGFLIPPLSLVIGFSLIFRYQVFFFLLCAVSFTTAGILLSVWGIKKFGLKNCGCYGPFENIPIKWSLAFHGVLLLGLIISLLYSNIKYPEGSWGKVLTGSFIALIGAKFYAKYLFAKTHRLLPGDYWKKEWLVEKEYQGIDFKNAYIAFINPDCQECRYWISLFNVMHALNKEFVPLGVLPQSAMHSNFMQENSNIKFPLKWMEDELFYSLVSETPTAFKLENYRITTYWKGKVPLELSEKFSAYWDSLSGQ